MEPIKHDDERYKLATSQGFNTFEEADKFLWDYCDKCRLEGNCAITYELRAAMDENYPMWDRNFVKLELKQEYETRIWGDVDPETILPERVISCKKFQLKQLDLSFME